MNVQHGWTLARIVAGLEVNGELQALPESFRTVAERMLAEPPEARGVAWNDFLSVRDDRDDIIKTMADIDPEGPCPEADPDSEEEAADGWGPIRLGSRPPAEPFPLDVLPLPAQDLAKSAARSISCPIDFLAVALLAAASGLIGRSVILLIKGGYFASASLYVALVGSPSSGKSPALRAALAPLWKIGQALYNSWRKEMEAWERREPEERGPEPVLQRTASTDPTTEALAPILFKNPRGLTVAPDEMTKWVMSMDQYKNGKGGDRPFYLSVWGSETVFIDRAKHIKEPIAVPYPYLTVVGGMTPDMLSTLSEGKGREDGFIARMLFCFPDRIPKRYSEEGIPDAVADEWNRLALALWARLLRQVKDGNPTPHVVRLTPEAARSWKAWVESHHAEQEGDDFPESMEGPWGKLEAYAARLALILYLMDLAADPTGRADAPSDMPARFIENAGRLVTYFKAHAWRVYATMGGKDLDGGEDVRALVRWILRGNLAKFSTRDIERNFDRFKHDPDALADALAWMKKHNLIRDHLQPEAPPRPGRKAAPSFEVNPSLGETPRFRQFRRNPTG